MMYAERVKFIKDYIKHWAAFEECSPIADGFECFGCMAVFIENGFNFHFGFYDPTGKKLAEYLLNAEVGTALMIHDERYTGDRNEYTGSLADILGGILGSEEYFRLVNKPFMVYEDAPEPMSMDAIWKDILSKMKDEDDYPKEEM